MSEYVTILDNTRKDSSGNDIQYIALARPNPDYT